MPGVPGAIACDTAVQFQAGCLDADSIHPFTSTANFSIEAWIRLPTQLANDAVIVGRIDQYGWRLLVKANGQVRIERHTQSTTYAETGVPPLAGADGAYHHVVGTYDGIDLRIYHDGAVADVRPSPDEMPAVGAQFTIGAASDCINLFFRGHIDEVAIYDVELSATAIAEHYQLGTQR
jgi:hypothetical protein